MQRKSITEDEEEAIILLIANGASSARNRWFLRVFVSLLKTSRKRGTHGDTARLLQSQSVLLQQTQNTVRRCHGRIINHQIFDAMFVHQARNAIELVIGNTVNVQGSHAAQQTNFGYQDSVPGNTNAATSKVVHHTKLDSRGIGAEPKAQKSLEKGKGGLVLVQALQLDTRRINNCNFIVINTEICAVWR